MKKNKFRISKTPYKQREPEHNCSRTPYEAPGARKKNQKTILEKKNQDRKRRLHLLQPAHKI